MSDLFNKNEPDDLFETIDQDSSIDLSQFVHGNKASASNESAQVTPVPAMQSTTESTPIIQKSPLALELEKKRNGTLGVEITKEQYESGKEKTEFRNPIDSDERREELSNAQDEADEMLKQRTAVIPLKQFENAQEYSQMVHEISLVKFDENGKAYIDYDKNDEGEIIPLALIRLRTENDPPFSKENDFLQMKRDAENRERVSRGLKPISNDVPLNANPQEVEEVEDPTTVARNKSVNIIIDKTGLGSNIEFTEEERQKLVEANEIKLTQVEVLDIASITTVKPERDSFTGKIHEYTLSGSKTTVTFPASGFKADITGLTYGEIGDIALSAETINVDKYYKRLSIIYNKMKNISSGPFESFEDFLKNFAALDIPLAIYGLYVSSFPEVQTIALKCGRSTCNKTFDWNFPTRNILKLDKSDEVLIDRIAELASADPDQYDDIYKRAAVRNIKYIKLPKCGYIIGIGVASAYEFLYNFIPVLDEQTFKDAFGDDINQVYLRNIGLLTTVLSVRIPDPEKPNTYALCEGYKDILDAIYSISPEEIKIIGAISSKIQKEYATHFSFGDVTCPHCQNVTKDMEIDLDSLVFQTYQRLLSTEVDLTNIQGL